MFILKNERVSEKTVILVCIYKAIIKKPTRIVSANPSLVKHE
jgi:hypothetical protein